MSNNNFSSKTVWWIAETVKLLIIDGITAYCFYMNWVGMIVGLPFIYVIFKKDIDKEICRQNKEILMFFSEMMKVVDANIGAGYSLENAFARSLSEVEGSCSKTNKFMVNEIRNGLSFNVDIEEIIKKIGKKFHSKDIANFAFLIEITKKRGGDMSMLIRQFNAGLSRRKMLDAELETMMAAKRYEGLIMIVMPYLIILYMQLTNKGFLDEMYNSLAGKMIMTISLLVIGVAYLITEKIIEKGTNY